jgi:hypothetical protein
MEWTVLWEVARPTDGISWSRSLAKTEAECWEIAKQKAAHGYIVHAILRGMDEIHSDSAISKRLKQSN